MQFTTVSQAKQKKKIVQSTEWKVISNVTNEWQDECRRMRDECRQVKATEDEWETSAYEAKTSEDE